MEATKELCYASRLVWFKCFSYINSFNLHSRPINILIVSIPFVLEEIEAKKVSMICPKHRAIEKGKWDFNPGDLGSRVYALNCYFI